MKLMDAKQLGPSGGELLPVPTRKVCVLTNCVWAEFMNAHCPSHTFRQDYPFYSSCFLDK